MPPSGREGRGYHAAHRCDALSSWRRWGAEAAAVGLLAGLGGCQAHEDAFIGGRLLSLCADSYHTCGVTATCVLDDEHYLRGSFPGARRVVTHTVEDRTELWVRLYFTEELAPGTELLVQVLELDCWVEDDGEEHLVDEDVFALAGQDRTLELQVTAAEAGEHLLEVYADAAAGWLLVDGLGE